MSEREPAGGVHFDEERIALVIHQITQARDQKTGLFRWDIKPPEEAFVNLCKENLVFPLNALFLLTTTVYADNSARQFTRICEPASFRKYKWLFDVKKVSRRTNSSVIDAGMAYLTPGYNGRALSYWKHNASLIQDQFGGDLNEFFRILGYDAPTILSVLAQPKDKASYDGFRGYGPKLSRLFLLWADYYKLTFKPLKRINEIGIPIDFQVARLLIQTSGINLSRETHKHWVQNPNLQEILVDAIEKDGHSPLYVSEGLWFTGSICCNSRLHTICLLASECTSLISREPYDRRGSFNPKDVGRNIHSRPANKSKNQEGPGLFDENQT